MVTIVIPLPYSHIDSRCSTKGYREHGDQAGVHWHGALLAPISSMAKLISYVHDMLKFERASSSSQVRTYCMIIGNYGGHMAYATELPFAWLIHWNSLIRRTLLR